MNKKEQKTKETVEKDNKPKTEENKTDKSLEKNPNENKNKKEKNKENISQLNDNHPQIKDQKNISSNQNKKETNEGKNIKKNSLENSISQEDYSNANAFSEYLDETGIPEAFQLIFTEIITKKINPENYFNYVGMRLRQIGKEINEIKNK